MIHRKIEDAILANGLPAWYRVENNSRSFCYVKVTAILENGLETIDENGRRAYIFTSSIASVEKIDDIQTVHIRTENE